MWQLLVCLLFLGGVGDDEEILKRGDANSDGYVTAADASYITNYLFNGGPAPPCANQADINNDGQVSIADASYLTNFLFLGGPEPPYPGVGGTECVADDAPYPGCEVSPCL